jgi:hypothetical protein
MGDKDLAILKLDIEDFLPPPPEEGVDLDELTEEADRLERPGVIHKIAAMYMQGAGVKNIATEVGARPGSVRNLVNRKVFKDIVAGFSEDIVQA